MFATRLAVSLTSQTTFLALLAGAAAGLAVTPVAHAQTRVWNQTSGSWGTVVSWSPADVPDNGAEIAEFGGIVAYVVDAGSSYSIGGVNITNPLAVVRTAAGTTLGLNGSSVNNGTILINASGANVSTVLSVGPPQTISGTGSIVLNANPGSLDSAYVYFTNGSSVLTLGSGQTLRGTGNVYANVNNLGEVQADVPSATLQLFSNPKSNSGTMRATNGGILAITTTGITQSGGGQIVADGGTVSVNSSTIAGGVLDSINAGVLQWTGTGVVDGSTVAGPMVVAPGSHLLFGGVGLTNNGTITVNPTAANVSTSLRCTAAGQVVDGVGTIVFNANPSSLDSAYLYFSAGGNVLTLGAGQTVVGTGNIYASITNNGTVQADVSGRTMQMLSESKTNNSVFRAINGGTLLLNGTTFNQGSGGVIRADGGTVSLTNCTINGGALASINGGVLRVDGSTRINGTINTNNLDVSTASALYLGTTGLTNDGTITVNPTGANSSSSINVDAPTSTVLGTGSVVLNANPSNLDSAYIYFGVAANVLTLPSTQTIRGTGRIYANVTNNGTIQADVGGRTLQLLNQPKANNSVVRAIGGGELLIESMTLTQGTGGVARADGGTVRLNSASIVGGSVAAINGGAFTITGSSGMYGVTVNDDANIIAGSHLTVSDAGLVNNGRIVVNSTAGNANTSLVLATPTGTISGTGTILLNADPSNADSAYLYYSNGTNVLTLGAGQTLAGNGRAYVRLAVQGTIAPGTPTDGTGTLAAAGEITMSPTAALDIQIGGTGVGEFDRVVSTAPFHADGLVRVTLVDGFTNPAVGTAFDVVTAPAVTGQCLQSDMPRGWSVFFQPGVLRVQYTGCLADLDCGNGTGTPDGAVDINDLLFFLNAFEAGNAAADLDDGSGTGTQDGGVDISDLLYFLVRFEGGC